MDIEATVVVLTEMIVAFAVALTALVPMTGEIETLGGLITSLPLVPAMVEAIAMIVEVITVEKVEIWATSVSLQKLNFLIFR